MFNWLLLLYIGLGLADFIQTIYGIFGMSLLEANPIMNPISDSIFALSIVKIIGTAIVAIIAYALHRRAEKEGYKEIAYLAIWLAIVLQGIAVLSNFLVIYLER